jgi:hypothetical protein
MICVLLLRLHQILSLKLKNIRVTSAVLTRTRARLHRHLLLHHPLRHRLISVTIGATIVTLLVHRHRQAAAVAAAALLTW